MTKQEIIKYLKNLNLPLGQYVVFGSGPLAIHMLRESKDIDLFISHKLHQQLKQRGWEEKFKSNGDSYLTKDVVEAATTWKYVPYKIQLEEIIAKAEIIEGIPFAPLEEVLKWKMACNREKDQMDIKLIKNYLTGS